MSLSRLFWLILIWFAASPALSAAEPVLRNLDIHGLRVGGTTTLTIDGDDLGKTPRLLLPFAAKQTLKAGGTDNRAAFEVALAEDVTPGYYNVRVVTEGGVSLPVVVGVDRLPQVGLVPAPKPGAPPLDLPVAVHGIVNNAGTAEVQFQAKAKQKVMIEVEAQRFGSKLRPVVHLYNAKKLQLAWSWGVPSLHGDARLEATLPVDGIYTVTVHDVEYAAAAPSFFRLRIGEWSFVDQVFPPVLARNQAAKVELLGMSKTAVVDVAASMTLEILPLAWPKDGLWSGPRPFVATSTHAEVLAQPKKDQPQDLPAGIVGVSGRLLTAYGEDRYRVPVTPGQKVRLEVFAERLGSPVDVALVVRNDKGDQLARAEDSPGTLDPALEYTVPDKVTSIIVGLVDAQGRAGPRAIYRLVVTPGGPNSSGGAGLKLTTTSPRLTLPVGGRVVVPVLVERHGYQGKLDLVVNLPQGMTLSGITIPEGADGTLVTVERGAAGFDALVTKWRGKAIDGVEQVALVKGHPLEDLQPWLATEVAVAPSAAKASDFAIDWRNLAADARLIPGSKLALPVKVARLDDKTTVRLTLLTSQRTPLVNNQPDPNKTLRQEKPVELPVKMADGELVLLVPATLSGPVYDVTVQAELLAANKKVLAVAYAPVRRMSVHIPIAVKLNGPNRVAAMHDAKKGTTFTIPGKIERDPGLKAEVTLKLTGLPPGVQAKDVIVKADATDFAYTVTLPPTVPAGEIKGLKLIGSYAPDPKQANIRVNSRDVEVTLILKAAAK